MIRGRTSLNYNGKFSSPAVTLGVFRSFSPVPPPLYSSQTLPLCLFQVFIIMMMGDNNEDGSDAVIIRGSDGNCHWSFCELEPGHMVDLVDGRWWPLSFNSFRYWSIQLLSLQPHCKDCVSISSSQYKNNLKWYLSPLGTTMCPLYFCWWPTSTFLPRLLGFFSTDSGRRKGLIRKFDLHRRWTAKTKSQ